MRMVTFHSHEDHRHSEVEKTINHLQVSSVSQVQRKFIERATDTEGIKTNVSINLPCSPHGASTTPTWGHLFTALDIDKDQWLAK